jgi:NADPH2:quinone reductase
MKAIRVEKQGGPEVLKLLDIAPIETPGPGQAVVRIVAAGVNFVDVGQRRGTYPRQVPFTPGAYSEAILADAERLIPLPDGFTFEEGAAFLLQV